jgi:hypothetical protein
MIPLKLNWSQNFYFIIWKHIGYERSRVKGFTSTVGFAKRQLTGPLLKKRVAVAELK